MLEHPGDDNLGVPGPEGASLTGLRRVPRSPPSVPPRIGDSRCADGEHAACRPCTTITCMSRMPGKESTSIRRISNESGQRPR